VLLDDCVARSSVAQVLKTKIKGAHPASRDGRYKSKTLMLLRRAHVLR
jgi:hypothetical protein